MSIYQPPLSLQRLVGSEPTGLLRLALRLDAMISGMAGLGALVASPFLETLLGTPRGLLGPVGLLLIVYALLLWALARPPLINHAMVWGVILLNSAWAIASLVVVVGGWWGLTALGSAIVLGQAAIVALMLDLQILGVRRVRAAKA